jgi:cyclohexanecarboxylate-CoA ligase
MNTWTGTPADRHPETSITSTSNDMIITDYWDAQLARGADCRALSSYQAGEVNPVSFTYGELDAVVTRMGAGLAALGVEKGSVVSCQLPNGWQMTALFLACARIGAVFNPLMPIFRERELRFMLGHARSHLLVVPQHFRGFDYAGMAAGIRADLPELRHVLVIGGDGDNSFEQQLLNREWEKNGDTQALFAERRPQADDIVQLLFTSGTTGEPKGVLHTSRTLLSNIIPYAERLELGHEDIIFMASPMAHQTGFLYGMLMPIYLGAAAVLQDVWDARTAIRIAAAEHPTFTMASTPFLADLIELAPQNGDALSSLRIFVSAGAPIPESLVEKAGKSINAKIISAWGMTETGASTMTRPQDHPERAIYTDGVALPLVEVQVVDDAGIEVPAGSEGHLQVRGASLFVGYLKRPDLYSVDAQGWFATGDLARMDAQGYIRITGRTKDVVIRGGENIPVVEVENLLYKHLAISAVALVGCPDERLGERVCAYVTLHDGYTDLSLDDAVTFLLEHNLSRNYLPEYLEVLPALPRTPSGKIQKFKLHERAASIRIDPAKRR